MTEPAGTATTYRLRPEALQLLKQATRPQAGAGPLIRTPPAPRPPRSTAKATPNDPNPPTKEQHVSDDQDQIEPQGDDAAEGMSIDEALGLPVIFPLDTANRALGIGRTTGYKLAKTDEYPVKVHRIGGAFKVARADLLRFLGIETP